MTEEINLGPTVAEYAEQQIKELNCQIKILERRRHHFNQLLRQYLNSKLLYSEYVADKAEPYQKKELP